MYKFSELPNTIFGKPKQFHVKDFKKLMLFYSFFDMQDYDFKMIYKKRLIKNKEFSLEEKERFMKIVNEMNMVHLILNNIVGIREPFFEFMNYCYEDFDRKKMNILLKVSDIEELKQIIINVNCLPFERKNPNAEIARFDSMRSILSEVTVSMESIYYTVWALTGNDPDNMKLYDYFNLFKRFKMIKAHDAGVIFKTVDYKGAVKLHPWFADELNVDNLVSLEQLKNKTL